MTDVDIVSGMPAEFAAKEKKLEHKRREEESLKLRASMAGISGSPDGQKLIALVKSVLIRRVETVLQDDPEAKAYMEILNAIGTVERFAEEAIRKLTERSLKNS